MMSNIRNIGKKIIKRNFSTIIKKSPLHDLHENLKPKYGNFAGYNMPMNFCVNSIKNVALGTRKEKSCSIFDVSHMGILDFSLIKDNEYIDINDKNNFLIEILEKVFPISISDKKNYSLNKSILTIMLNNKGNVIDDLIITNVDNYKFRLVVNAANKFFIRETLYSQIKNMYNNEIEKINGSMINLSLKNNAILAIQGELSEEIISNYFKLDFSTLAFNDNITLNNNYNNQQIEISRCGYTGEDGFELYLPIEESRKFYKYLIDLKYNDNIYFGGLIERDILRLEAGLCLSGNEFSENMDIKYNELDMNFLINKRRKKEKNFIGDLNFRNGNKKRIGFITPKPVKNGDIIFYDNAEIGFVSSATKSFYLDKFIGMGYIDNNFTNNNDLYILSKSNKVDMELTKLPFIKHNYKR